MTKEGPAPPMTELPPIEVWNASPFQLHVNVYLEKGRIIIDIREKQPGHGEKWSLELTHKDVAITKEPF